MKVNQSTTRVTLGLYHLLTVGEVYSRDTHHGTRVDTKYFMRTDKGMVCLDNGAFIPAEAYTQLGGAYYGAGFRHCPTAHLSV